MFINLLDSTIAFSNKDDKLVRKVITRSRHSPLQILYEAFLPTGYPNTVSQDYLAYQIWDSLQAGCSSLTGILASRAILQGVGVGDETATATAAVINWMIKDGTSMLGRILFTWFEGTNLDVNAKTWRFMADIINDGSFFLDIISPILPKSLFLPIVSTSGVMKAIVGVSGGASRTALTQHQARNHNIADVSAKDGSQEMAVGLLSMLLGLYLIPFIETPKMIWLSFAILTFLHLYFNYRAVVVLEKINPQRASILISSFAESLTSGRTFSLTPFDVSKMERLFFLDPAHPKRIRLGVSLVSLLGSKSEDLVELEVMMKKWEGERYIINKSFPNEFRVAFRESARSVDYFKAYFHCEILNHIDRGTLKMNLTDGSETEDINEIFAYFEATLHSLGWNTKDFLMGPSEWRIKVT